MHSRLHTSSDFSSGIVTDAIVSRQPGWVFFVVSVLLLFVMQPSTRAHAARAMAPVAYAPPC